MDTLKQKRHSVLVVVLRIVLSLAFVAIVLPPLLGISIVPDPEQSIPILAAPIKSRSLASPTAGKSYSARTAHAAELDGEMDLVADGIFGQPDFTSGTVPATATGDTLYQPSDIFVYAHRSNFHRRQRSQPGIGLE